MHKRPLSVSGRHPGERGFSQSHPIWTGEERRTFDIKCQDLSSDTMDFLIEESSLKGGPEQRLERRCVRNRKLGSFDLWLFLHAPCVPSSVCRCPRPPSLSIRHSCWRGAGREKTRVTETERGGNGNRTRDCKSGYEAVKRPDKNEWGRFGRDRPFLNHPRSPPFP